MYFSHGRENKAVTKVDESNEYPLNRSLPRNCSLQTKFLRVKKLNIIQLHTVFSPIWDRSSPFISENWTSAGKSLTDVCLRVSPSLLLTVIDLSSLPSANRFSLLQAPHVIFLECFPMMGIFLKLKST